MEWKWDKKRFTEDNSQITSVNVLGQVPRKLHNLILEINLNYPIKKAVLEINMDYL